MKTLLIIGIIALSIVLIIGLVLGFSPEGYEDESGFNYGKKK